MDNMKLRGDGSDNVFTGDTPGIDWQTGAQNIFIGEPLPLKHEQRVEKAINYEVICLVMVLIALAFVFIAKKFNT